jgi:hypothetical protein
MKSVEKMKKEFKRRLLPRCVRNPWKIKIVA